MMSFTLMVEADVNKEVDKDANEKASSLIKNKSLLGVGRASKLAYTTTQFIKVDQFGYQNVDEKVAVISNPQKGYNNVVSFTPGKIYQVRNWDTNAVVFTGTPVSWKNGATHDQSGDKVWWFDFSALSAPGSYYVYDVDRKVGSGRFEINNTVYKDVMKAAMRMLYYQRSGFAKTAPYADPGYTDGEAYIQDKKCHFYDSTKIMPVKDLSGGWFDAGDFNKYVNYAWDPVLDLLLAYEQKPTVWRDDYNIPESGNGVPDILDEVQYELNWLLKMQNDDGSILSVVGTNHHENASPPSKDNSERFYGKATTQATYAGAGMFALAAIQFDAVGQKTYAATLKKAAISAWNWASLNPGVIFHNDEINIEVVNGQKVEVQNYLAAGDQEGGAPDWATGRKKYAAAVYLFAATGNPAYQAFIDENYTDNFSDTAGATADYIPETDASLYYTKTIGATVAVKNDILQMYVNSMQKGVNNYPSVSNKTDAYRAYISEYNWDTGKWESIHNWGSNVVKAHQAIVYLNMRQYNLDSANIKKYDNAASGFVHYFHGVNPNSKTYLTNMDKYGAEYSVKSLYHAWFGANPPPGYVPGGPNQHYKKNADCYLPNPPAGCTSNIIAPEGQPPQKSWRDFSADYPLDSWTVTEPQILSQGAYVRMLSKFL